MWLSHPSLEYAHHAHLSASASCGYVAISLIPGVRPPRPPLCPCQPWLRGYLTHPWSTPTTPTSLPLPAVATWLSNLSLEYAHRSASASCGYLTYPRIMPTTPTLLPAAATWLLINPWSMHTTPSQVCLSHLSLEYAHHTHPLPAVATWLSHLSLEHTQHARSSTSCDYVAMPPIPGVRPTHLAICQVWLCGYLPYPLSTPAAPTLCQPAAATQLSHLSLKYTHPSASCGYTTSHLALDNTPTTPSKPQVWWLCGHLNLHQLGFSG